MKVTRLDFTIDSVAFLEEFPNQLLGIQTCLRRMCTRLCDSYVAGSDWFGLVSSEYPDLGSIPRILLKGYKFPVHRLNSSLNRGSDEDFL